MMRPEGWELRLSLAIEAARDRVWAWGTHDCATFAYRCVRAMLDAETTPFDAWMMPPWDSRKTAQARLDAAGGCVAGMDALCDRRRPGFAQRGDLAALDLPDGPVMGVVEGGHLWIARAPKGVLACRLEKALAVWAW